VRRALGPLRLIAARLREGLTDEAPETLAWRYPEWVVSG